MALRIESIDDPCCAGWLRHAYSAPIEDCLRSRDKMSATTNEEDLVVAVPIIGKSIRRLSWLKAGGTTWALPASAECSAASIQLAHAVMDLARHCEIDHGNQGGSLLLAPSGMWWRPTGLKAAWHVFPSEPTAHQLLTAIAAAPAISALDL